MFIDNDVKLRMIVVDFKALKNNTSMQTCLHYEDIQKWFSKTTYDIGNYKVQIHKKFECSAIEKYKKVQLWITIN